MSNIIKFDSELLSEELKKILLQSFENEKVVLIKKLAQINEQIQTLKSTFFKEQLNVESADYNKSWKWEHKIKFILNLKNEPMSMTDILLLVKQLEPYNQIKSDHLTSVLTFLHNKNVLYKKKIGTKVFFSLLEVNSGIVYDFKTNNFQYNLDKLKEYSNAWPWKFKILFTLKNSASSLFFDELFSNLKILEPNAQITRKHLSVLIVDLLKKGVIQKEGTTGSFRYSLKIPSFQNN